MTDKYRSVLREPLSLQCNDFLLIRSRCIAYKDECQYDKPPSLAYVRSLEVEIQELKSQLRQSKTQVWLAKVHALPFFGRPALIRNRLLMQRTRHIEPLLQSRKLQAPTLLETELFSCIELATSAGRMPLVSMIAAGLLSIIQLQLFMNLPRTASI